MDLSVLGWIITVEMVLVLLLLWNSDRKIRHLFAESLNSLNQMRTAVEMAPLATNGVALR